MGRDAIFAGAALGGVSVCVDSGFLWNDGSQAAACVTAHDASHSYPHTEPQAARNTAVIPAQAGIHAG